MRPVSTQLFGVLISSALKIVKIFDKRLTQQPSSDTEKAALIVELSQAGINHTPEKIVRIAKLADGKIVFLEEGDDRRGLQHILAKANQFAKVGIDEDEIPDAVMEAAITGIIVGYQGKSHDKPRAIYKFIFKGEIKYISLSMSENRSSGITVYPSPSKHFPLIRLLASD